MTPVTWLSCVLISLTVSDDFYVSDELKKSIKKEYEVKKILFKEVYLRNLNLTRFWKIYYFIVKIVNFKTWQVFAKFAALFSNCNFWKLSWIWKFCCIFFFKFTIFKFAAFFNFTVYFNLSESVEIWCNFSEFTVSLKICRGFSSFAYFQIYFIWIFFNLPPFFIFTVIFFQSLGLLRNCVISSNFPLFFSKW